MKNRSLPIRPILDARTANAFLFGLIMNQAQQAERSWNAPYVLEERLGSRIPEQIIEMGMENIFHAFSLKPVIHRFVRLMSTNIFNTSILLVEKYAGDARAIWSPPTKIQTLIKRFCEFPGIGVHKASVGIYLLTLECGVPVIADGTSLSIDTRCPALFDIYQIAEPILVKEK